MPSTERAAEGANASRLRRLAAWLGVCALSACHSSNPQRWPSPGPAPVPAPRVTPPAAPPPRPARTVEEYKRQMGLRLVAANPGITYTGRAPDILMGIPVLQVEVGADGAVRHISVVRTPGQARETVQIAIDAVKRAQPFGDASQVPGPWKFLQVFLFDYDGRFKPKVLD